MSAVLPSSEIGLDTQMVKDWAQAVEDLGFDGIVAYDHVLGAGPERAQPLTGPYTHEHPFREPLTLFAYLAGTTRTVTLMTGVLVLPQRQTALVAKQAAEIDLLSGGRLVLGVGIGWNPVEYAALGVPFADRGARLEEQVHVLRRLWTQPLVDVAAPYHLIESAGILPRPKQAIPVWFGGRSPAALQRAARLGDGFIFTTIDDDSCRAAQMLAAFPPADRLLPVARDRSFGLCAQVHGAADVDEIESQVRRWGRLAGTGIAATTLARPQDTPLGQRLEAHIDSLTVIADVVREVRSPSKVTP
jgi:probable F420-dependent oxidoreductase